MIEVTQTLKTKLKLVQKTTNEEWEEIKPTINIDRMKQKFMELIILELGYKVQFEELDIEINYKEI